MGTNSERSWERPWPPNEMIANAPNWTLAGDAGLLNYLEKFSGELLAKANETNDNVDKLLGKLNDVSVSLEVVKNEFSSLRNTQFVESRVYEEDETLSVQEEASQSKEQKPETKQDENIQEIKEAVLRGIALVDKYYDKVDVPASDSEDETDFPNFVLNPKDLYQNRPLPYVIGTDEWYKKWHVGLVESSSDSEEEKVSEKFSDSDSDDDFAASNRTQHRLLNNASAIPNQSQPVANSTFNEQPPRPDIFASSDSEEYSSAPTQAPIASVNFANELAAKLGTVANQNLTEPEVNRRPIQSQTATSATVTIGNIFSDEPPPIDDEGRMFSRSNRGSFGGAGGLFDDPGDDFWGTKSKLPSKAAEASAISKDVFAEGDNDIFSKVEPSKPDRKASLKAKSLFDDNGSDDDLFVTKPLDQLTNKPYLPQPSAPAVPFFDDEPPPVFEPPKPNVPVQVPKKKPAGGISIFGGADLFAGQKDILKNRRQSSSESSESESTPSESVKASGFTVKTKDEPKQPSVKNEVTAKESESKIKEEPKKSKTISLFDDNDDLFEDNLFSNAASKKFTSSLFDDIPPYPTSEQTRLFDAEPPKPKGITSNSLGEIQKKLTSSLFDDEPPDLPTTQKSLFDDKQNKLVTSDKDQPGPSVMQKSLFDDKQKNPTSTFENVKKPKTISLFDDDFNEEDDDDIFSNKKLTPSASESKESEEKSKNSLHVAFLEDNPPNDDDNWETRSNSNVFNENEENNSSLFHPRHISIINALSESSGIVQDGSSRAVDDTFAPYASSTRRQSTSIFNEEQSSDNLFITRSKSASEPVGGRQTLGDICEDSRSSDSSFFDITPSGNPDKIYESASSNQTISQDSVFMEGENSESIPKVSVEKNDMKAKALPGKLKHNLKINVNALIPGSLPPKRTADSTKSPTNEKSESKVVTKEPTNQKPHSQVVLPSENPPEQKQPESKVDSGSNPEVLTSITKDRVRIPVRRKPSTRRGRQEALRQSGIDFKLHIPDDDENVTSSTAEEQKQASPEVSKTDPNKFLSKTNELEAPETCEFSSEIPETSESKPIGVTSKEIVASEISEVEKPLPHETNSSTKVSEVRKTIFDEKNSFTSVLSESCSPLTSTFEKNPPENDSLFEPATKPRLSIFDDANDPDDIFADIFASASSKPLFEQQTSDDIFGSAPSLATDNVFGSAPPLVKSDQSQASKVAFSSAPAKPVFETAKSQVATKATSPQTLSTKVENVFQPSVLPRSQEVNTLSATSDFEDIFNIPPENIFSPEPKETANSSAKLLPHQFESRPSLESRTPPNFHPPLHSRPSLFESDDLEDADLFSSSKKLGLFSSPGETSTVSILESSAESADDVKNLNLFDEADDLEDDIFAKKKPQPKTTLLKKLSLFDDDPDDDDDLFGGGSSKTKTSDKSSQSKLSHPKKTMNVVKKKEGRKAVEDPLGLFQD